MTILDPNTLIYGFDPAAVSPGCAQAYTAYLENRRKSAHPAASKTPLPDFFIGAHASSFLNLPVATADPTVTELITPK